MSYSELFVVDESGNVRPVCEFRNANRGAMLWWDWIAVKYGITDAPFRLLTSGDEAMERLWALASAPEVDVDPDIRIVLATTFDRVVVKRSDLGRVVRAFENFASAIRHPVGSSIKDDPGDPGHAPEMARALALIEAVAAPGLRGVCWNQMSVCQPFWWVYPDEEHEEEGKAYNVDSGSGHWWLDLQEHCALPASP